MTNRLFILGCGFAAVLLIALGLVSSISIYQLEQVAQERSKNLLELNELNKIFSSLKDAETSQRGYLIMGNESYLAPYKEAVAFFQSAEVNDFFNQIPDTDPTSKSEYIQLYQLILQKFNELRIRIEIRRNNGFDAAQKLVSDNSGKQTMDEIRKTINTITEKKEELLLHQSWLVKNNTNNTLLIIIGGYILFISLLSCCLLYLYKNMKIRQEAELSLKKLNALQTAILKSANHAIIACDIEGTIKTFNKGAEHLFGYTEEEVINMSLTNFYSSHEVENWKNEFIYTKGTVEKECLEAILKVTLQRTEEVLEWPQKRKDGSSFIFSQTIAPLKDEYDNLVGFLAIGVDVTARRAWELELIKAEKRERAASLSKSQFLANMSHDLLTPLNSVIGFSTLLLKNDRQHLDEDELTYSRKICENGKHLLHRINVILDLSKIELGSTKLNISRIDFHELILSICQELAPHVKRKEIEVTIDEPESLEPLETDKEKLRKILGNLIENAIKFTVRGFVKIVIKKDSENHIQCIQVIDSGPGIGPKELDKLFTPFYQINMGHARPFEGSGLGLFISKSLATLLGFRIEVTSELGKGSTFTLILSPLSKDLHVEKNDEQDLTLPNISQLKNN